MVVRRVPVGAQPELPVPRQPTEEPLHHPTEYPQPAPVFRVPSRHLRVDGALPQLLAVRVAVLRSVGVPLLWPLLWATYLPRHGFDGIDDIQ